MSNPPVLTGQDIGRAHHAVRALLERQLEPTGLDFERWVMLNSVGSGGPVPEAELTVFVVNGLKITEQRARQRVAELLGAGLLVSSPDDVVSLSGSGQELWTQMTARVRPITGYLFEGFTDAEKVTAAKLLTQVTERADAALAGSVR